MTAAPSMRRWAIEFKLYLLRNPDARERVAAKRSEVVDAARQVHRGGHRPSRRALLIPPATFARVIIATTDSVVLGSHLDDIDLYRPIIEMYVSAIKLP